MRNRIIIDNVDDSVIHAIALLAKEHRRTVEEEARNLLESSVMPDAKVKAMRANVLIDNQKALLKKRGGKVFSDSSEIIRKSRLNDF